MFNFLFRLRELPRQADSDNWRYQLRTRAFIPERYEKLHRDKVQNKAIGHYAPPVVFHQTITNQEDLEALLEKMVNGEEVEEDDRLYLTANNHNYLSNQSAYDELLRHGEKPEDIGGMLYMDVVPMRWPAETHAQNLARIRAVSLRC